MTLTAIQLREKGSGTVTTHLVYGQPDSTKHGSLGLIALFPPDQLVGYLISAGSQVRLFLFRTLAKPTRDSSTIPGIYPAVDLLLQVRTRRRARLVRQLLQFLERYHRDPRTLSDAFWLRVAAHLGGRLTARRLVLALLEHEPLPP